MTRSEIIKALAEIAAYFYEHYKVLEGTPFGENYNRWRRAVTRTAWLLEGGDTNADGT